MFRVFLISSVIYAASAVDFLIVNKESAAVWVGIQGNVGKEDLNNGGFILEAGASTTVTASDDWAGRFWGRSYCDPGTNYCQTGDCGSKLECAGAGGNPPASLAEILLKGAGGFDFYDISLMEGFNLPISIEPVGGTGDDDYPNSCLRAACLDYLNGNCPDDLRLNTDAGTIGCKSACLTFNTDQYCCRNDFGTPDTCKPSTWPVNYPEYFKTNCPDAYSYIYDDQKSTFICQAETYVVTFGV